MSEDVFVQNFPDDFPLTRRELFAAFALVGLLANETEANSAHKEFKECVKQFTSAAFAYADEMETFSCD